MDICDIMQALERNRGFYPREALQEAILRREEIIPEMLSVLSDVVQRAEEIVEDEEENPYYAHFYAIFLLAQFRESRAYPLLATFARLPESILDDLVGDFITENLGRVLASVCDGNTALIESLIEDSTVHEYVRAAAIESLKIMVAQGDLSRDTVMAYFKVLFDERLEKKFSFVWNELVSVATRLHPEEVYNHIVKAYEDGLVENCFMSLADVDKVLAMNREKVLNRLPKSSPGYIEDIHKEMEWWYCFNREKYSQPHTQQVAQKEIYVPKANASLKAGPNEPCICGSGRKYKKCCGRIS